MVILLVEGNTMGKHLHPSIESGTLRVYVYVHDGHGCVTEEVDSHTTKIQRAFRPSVLFWKICLGNHHWFVWGSYSSLILTKQVTIYTLVQSWELLGFTHVCMRWASQRIDGLSHYWKLTSLSALSSIFKNNLGTNICQCKGHTLGWRWHNGWMPTSLYRVKNS